MRKLSESGWNIYVGQNIIVNLSQRLEPLFLDLYYLYCIYSHALTLFVYL